MHIRYRNAQVHSHTHTTHTHTHTRRVRKHQQTNASTSVRKKERSTQRDRERERENCGTWKSSVCGSCALQLSSSAELLHTPFSLYSTSSSWKFVPATRRTFHSWNLSDS